MKIKKVFVKKILNSLGKFGIEITTETKDGKFSGSAPQGTSKGKYEVREYVRSLDTTINRVRRFCEKIRGFKIKTLEDIFNIEKKAKRLGGNVAISLSFSLIRALAAEIEVPVWKIFTKVKKVPKILSKVIGGGVHAGENSPTFQEFLVLYNLKNLKKVIKIYEEIGKTWGGYGKDLEGGWILNISNETALDIIKKYKLKIGIDVAASQFYKNGRYVYRNISPVKVKGKIIMPKLTKDKILQINYIEELQKKYNIYYIEDPLNEEDFDGFAKLTSRIGKKCLIVGDDLFVTNPERLKIGIRFKACNGCIVKPNQIGSLKETIEFVDIAKKYKYLPIISHRSGETNDNMIADLAVGLQVPIIKIGICGGERVSKINRLLEIEGE